MVDEGLNGGVAAAGENSVPGARDTGARVVLPGVEQLAPDPRGFREVAGLFATGVTVIVTETGGQIRGMTANSVASVSLDPLLMLFCPNRKAHIAQDMPALRRFTINILRQEQQALSTYFAGGWRQSQPPPFEFHPSPAGPYLAGCLASIGCETERVIEAGDHWMVLGRVTWLQRSPGPHNPLLFMSGQYRVMNQRQTQQGPDFTP